MGCIISSDGIVYGGLDESNHGNFPEFFSLVLSGYLDDSKKSKHKISKAKKYSKINLILSEVRKRGHTFLQVRKGDYERIFKNQLIGKITVSLSKDFLPLELDKFELFIDGKLSNTEKIYTRDLLAEVYNFSKKQVQIKCGSKFYYSWQFSCFYLH